MFFSAKLEGSVAVLYIFWDDWTPTLHFHSRYLVVRFSSEFHLQDHSRAFYAMWGPASPGRLIKTATAESPPKTRWLTKPDLEGLSSRMTWRPSNKVPEGTPAAFSRARLQFSPWFYKRIQVFCRTKQALFPLNATNGLFCFLFSVLGKMKGKENWVLFMNCNPDHSKSCWFIYNQYSSGSTMLV